MEWTIFSRQCNSSMIVMDALLDGINFLFFSWLRMGLLWFLLDGWGSWGQVQRVVLIMVMVVGQQRKNSYFLLTITLLILKDTLLIMVIHVLYEREFMFKTRECTLFIQRMTRSLIHTKTLLSFFFFKKLLKSYVFLLMTWLVVQVDEDDLSFQASTAENVEVQLTLFWLVDLLLLIVFLFNQK